MSDDSSFNKWEKFDPSMASDHMFLVIRLIRQFHCQFTAMSKQTQPDSQRIRNTIASNPVSIAGPIGSMGEWVKESRKNE